MAVTQYCVGLVVLGLLSFGLQVLGGMHTKRKAALDSMEPSLHRVVEKRWARSYYAAYLLLVGLFLLVLWWTTSVAWHMGPVWQGIFVLLGGMAGYSLPTPKDKKFWHGLVGWAMVLAAAVVFLHMIHIRHYLPFIPIVTVPISF